MLPVLREKEAPEWGATDREGHGNDAIPQAELPRSHVVIQQEEWEHSDGALFAWTQPKSDTRNNK